MRGTRWPELSSQSTARINFYPGKGKSIVSPQKLATISFTLRAVFRLYSVPSSSTTASSSALFLVLLRNSTLLILMIMPKCLQIQSYLNSLLGYVSPIPQSSAESDKNSTFDRLIVNFTTKPRIQVYREGITLLLSLEVLDYKVSSNCMHENFTSNSEAVYLANLTQSKKISYLEKQLANSQFYSRTIEQQLQGLRMTMSRILRERTNHQVMVRMYQTLFHLERRCKQMSDMLKQSNARNLIEMQMRIQEKSEYMEKTRDLEQELQFIRKNNRDKEQEFTIVVNKLRKYEDINELTLEDKLGRDSKNQLIILSEDKQELIRSMAEELNHYRKIYHHDKVDLDKKIAILEFAVQNRVSYETLMESYYESLKAPDRKSQAHRLLSSEVKVGRDSWKDRDKFSENMNENTRQLIKQIKKLVLSNKLLQAALNQCLEKNQQLALNNQILMDANLQLKRQLSQAHKHENSPIYRKTSPSHLYNSTLKPRQEQLHNADNFLSRASAKQTHLRSTDPATNVVRDDFFYQDRAASAGELARQRKLRNYLHNLKSTEYEVNVESLVKDVSNMSQLLVLNLGKASMNGQGNGTSYSVYLQREGREREVRSISADILKDRGKIKKVESILKQQQIAESCKNLQQSLDIQQF